DARERRRLQQHEDELERGVAVGEVEARRSRDAGQAARERREEEQRERERRDQQRLVVEKVVQHAPGDALGDGERPHDRASLCRSAHDASAIATTAIPPAIPNPSASASASQPTTIRLRTPSIRYETGLPVATQRNQSTLIRLRGIAID